MEVRFTILNLQILKMNRASVNPYRSSCFHPFRMNTMSSNAFGKSGNGRFRYSSSWKLMPSDVHQSVKKRSSCNYNTPGIESNAPYSANSSSRAVLHEQFLSLVLPDIEIVGIVEHSAPLPYKFPAVALRPRAPYRRSFRTVKHTELNSRGISNASHLSAEGVNLSHNLSFCDTTHGRVAAHLSDFVHIHGYKTGLCAHVGRCHSSLATGVSTAYNQYVIFKIHK